eukprot:Awhi_evm1s6507
MPGMDGFTVAFKIREMEKKYFSRAKKSNLDDIETVHIIALSATSKVSSNINNYTPSSNNEDKKEALLHMNSFMPKPFDLKIMKQTLADLKRTYRGKD